MSGGMKSHFAELNIFRFNCRGNGFICCIQNQTLLLFNCFLLAQESWTQRWFPFVADVYWLIHVHTSAWEPGLKTESQNAFFRIPSPTVSQGRRMYFKKKMFCRDFYCLRAKTFVTVGITQLLLTRKCAPLITCSLIINVLIFLAIKYKPD